MKNLFDGSGMVVDRRSFLGSVGVVAGTAATASLLPTSALFAAPGNVMACTMPTDSLPDGIADGDSVFGHFPPYAHPIGYGKVRHETVDIASAQAVDRNFLV